VCDQLKDAGAWSNPGAKGFAISPAAQGNIRCGYIALMDDKRRVPPPARIVGQTYRLDSFPVQIARAANQGETPRRLDAGPLYASYISQATLNQSKVFLSAADLLGKPDKARALLQGNPVIIGAAWHTRAIDQGPVVDMHDTPIGTVVGPLIHENLAEAVLAGRTYSGLPEPLAIMLEVAIGVGALWLFAKAPAWPLAPLGMLALSAAGLFLLQWLSLQLFGAFIDMFLPVTGLALHAIVERLIGASEERGAEEAEPEERGAEGPQQDEQPQPSPP
jgi:hypothetical protein